MYLFLSPDHPLAYTLSRTHAFTYDTYPKPIEAHRLLSQVLVGVGNPLESSGALEALSHGCVFINPMFKGPRRGVLASKYYRKPTSRMVSDECQILNWFNL